MKIERFLPIFGMLVVVSSFSNPFFVAESQFQDPYPVPGIVFLQLDPLLQICREKNECSKRHFHEIFDMCWFFLYYQTAPLVPIAGCQKDFTYFCSRFLCTQVIQN